MTFTLRTARYCVRATYGGRRVEIYVFPPWCEVWVQDVRLRADDLTLAVGLPKPALGLTEPLAPAPGSPEAPWLFSNAALDGQAVQQFLKADENVADLRRLDLHGREFAIVSSGQMILRSRVGDVQRLISRMDALRRLWERNGRATRPTALISGVFALRVANAPEVASARSPHRFGGRLEPPIACASCGHPLNLLVRLDVSDGMLGLPPVAGGFLPVAYCLACQPAGPTTLAFEGGRWVLKEEGPGQFQPPAAELAERRLAVSRVDDRTGLPSFVARVGGEPDWIQAAETPDCPGCGGLMPFLLQLPSDPAADVQFGDDGVLYAFFCAPCAMVTSLTQSH